MKLLGHGGELRNASEATVEDCSPGSRVGRLSILRSPSASMAVRPRSKDGRLIDSIRSRTKNLAIQVLTVACRQRFGHTKSKSPLAITESFRPKEQGRHPSSGDKILLPNRTCG